MKFDLTQIIDSPYLVKNNKELLPNNNSLSFDQELPTSIYATNNGLKHYSEFMDDTRYAQEIFCETGKPYMFTDEYGNTIICGYYATISSGDNHFKVLKDSGILTQGNKYIFGHSFDRYTGSSWKNKTTQKAINEFRKFLKEINGYQPTPILFYVRGVEPMSWSRFFDTFKDLVLWAVEKILNIVTLGAFDDEIHAVISILKVWADTGQITIKDIFNIISKYAKINLNDVEIELDSYLSEIGMSFTDIKNYYNIGSQIWHIAENPRDIVQYRKLLQAIDVNTTKQLEQIISTVNQGNVMELARMLGVPPNISEKIQYSINLSKTINNLSNKYNMIENRALTFKDALQVDEIQDTIIATFGTLANQSIIYKDVEDKIKGAYKLISTFPNRLGALTTIAKNHKFQNPEIFKTIIDLASFNYDELDLNHLSILALDSVIERAKEYKEKGIEFVMPSILPSMVQNIFADEIRERLGIDAIIPSASYFS